MLKNSKNLFYSSDIFDKGILNVFLTRKIPYENDSFEKNIRAVENFLTSEFDLKEDLRFVFMDQVHSTSFSFVFEEFKDKFLILPRLDAVFTPLRKTVLIVKTADCLPVFFQADRFIGVAHIGWLGTLKNFPNILIDQLLSFKVDIKGIRIAIGPHIGQCCYEIDDERYHYFAKAYPELIGQVILKEEGSYHLNLGYLNFLLFKQAGVLAENIDFFPFCTKCDKRFFSFRRDKDLKFLNLSFLLKL